MPVHASTTSAICWAPTSSPTSFSVSPAGPAVSAFAASSMRRSSSLMRVSVW